MANNNAPYGFRPVRYFDGTPWTGSGRPYYVPSTYGSNIFVGDPVLLSGTANTAEFQGFQPGALAGVVLGTGGSGVLWTGICVGIQPVTRDSTTYHSASTEGIIFVADDPNIVFSVQDDGGSGATGLGATSVGLNAIGIAGSGSTVTGRSGWMMDGGTGTAPGSNSAYQLFIIGGGRGMLNDVTLPYANWEVLLNKQTYKPATALGV